MDQFNGKQHKNKPGRDTKRGYPKDRTNQPFYISFNAWQFHSIKIPGKEDGQHHEYCCKEYEGEKTGNKSVF
jgi:hypothetical protein